MMRQEPEEIIEGCEDEGPQSEPSAWPKEPATAAEQVTAKIRLALDGGPGRGSAAERAMLERWLGGWVESIPGGDGDKNDQRLVARLQGDFLGRAAKGAIKCMDVRMLELVASLSPGGLLSGLPWPEPSEGASWEGSLVSYAAAWDAGDGALLRAAAKLGADLWVRDERGGTALAAAAANGRHRALDWMLAQAEKAGMDLRAMAEGAPPHDGPGVSPLRAATLTGDLRCLARLLDTGASADAPGPGGRTLLIEAAEAGLPEVITALLAAGASIDRADNHGETPLMAATRLRSAAAVKLLIARGADAKLQNVAGETALIIAAGWANGHGLECMRLLAKKGGVEQRNAKGESILDLAIVEGHWEIVEELCQGGADALRAVIEFARHRMPKTAEMARCAHEREALGASLPIKASEANGEPPDQQKGPGASRQEATPAPGGARSAPRL
jgi:ankyrin repeat protein